MFDDMMYFQILKESKKKKKTLSYVLDTKCARVKIYDDYKWMVTQIHIK